MIWRYTILTQQAEEVNIHKSAELSCLPNCKVASIQPVNRLSSLCLSRSAVMSRLPRRVYLLKIALICQQAHYKTYGNLVIQ